MCMALKSLEEEKTRYTLYQDKAIKSEGDLKQEIVKLGKENNDLCSANLENKQFVTETEHVVKEDNYNKTKFFDKKLEQKKSDDLGAANPENKQDVAELGKAVKDDSDHEAKSFRSGDEFKQEESEKLSPANQENEYQVTELEIALRNDNDQKTKSSQVEEKVKQVSRNFFAESICNFAAVMMTKELGKKLFQKKSNDVRSSTQENEPHSAELKDAAKHDEDFKANSSEVDQELKQTLGELEKMKNEYAAYESEVSKKKDEFQKSIFKLQKERDDLCLKSQKNQQRVVAQNAVGNEVKSAEAKEELKKRDEESKKNGGLLREGKVTYLKVC
ncbi:unnamed protein product [Enterobius vermicularis]|uniref:Protein MNN4-like n=1 Tax=Enterobius vermicularis TaxID=51028 RepID=A0A0N4V4H2_ENTVE|nr:unnamed protein product [Enterobius vermicularis]